MISTKAAQGRSGIPKMVGKKENLKEWVFWLGSPPDIHEKRENIPTRGHCEHRYRGRKQPCIIPEPEVFQCVKSRNCEGW